MRKTNRTPKGAKGRNASSFKPDDRCRIYRRILEPVRLKPSTLSRESWDLEALSDKSRIINSAPFRRLQGKAQVFSLARSGAVRTRLTHSIEVSNYGELIAGSIAHQLVERKTLPEELRLCFVQTVENACLLHDIGNPPFGHMGEYAIGNWFRHNREDLVNHWVNLGEITRGEAERHLDAFADFDGNPQGLRIMTRLQWLYDEYGMNLTCPLIGAYTKYLGSRADSASRFMKKIGYFPSEEETIKQTWAALGLGTTPSGTPLQRHPLAFVMEAADDIAFCLSDIEDALEKHIVTEREFLDATRDELTEWIEPGEVKAEKVGDTLTTNGTYHLFRLALSRDLVRTAAQAYVDNESAILAGDMDTSLLGSKERPGEALGALKAFASDRIYTAREAVEIELGGLRAIGDILDAFKRILLLRREDFELLGNKTETNRFKKYPIEVLLRSFLPTKQMRAYEWQTHSDPRLEPIHRTQLVVDYLSGMTDSHALKVYHMITATGPTDIE